MPIYDSRGIIAYTLADETRDRVRWACRHCPLHGQYRTMDLRAKLCEDIAMPDLLRKLAEACGCERKRSDWDPCGAYYLDPTDAAEIARRMP